MGAQIGGAVTASLTPAIASRFGWTASFLVAAVLCLLGAAAWIFVDPKQTLQEQASDTAAMPAVPNALPSFAPGIKTL
jgi:ACS family glucarate transporter-like MFS transporter